MQNDGEQKDTKDKDARESRLRSTGLHPKGGAAPWLHSSETRGWARCRPPLRPFSSLFPSLPL